MTAYEAREKYGNAGDGYVKCANCPIYHDDEDGRLCGRNESGYSTCWKRIAQYMTADAVDHPTHYNQGKYECIEVMAETFGKEATRHFCLLNSFKYIWRTGEKNGVEDIEKAKWYLDKYIELDGESDE